MKPTPPCGCRRIAWSWARAWELLHALALASGQLLAQVDVAALQAQLRADGVYLADVPSVDVLSAEVSRRNDV